MSTRGGNNDAISTSPTTAALSFRVIFCDTNQVLNFVIPRFQAPLPGEKFAHRCTEFVRFFKILFHFPLPTYQDLTHFKSL
jgi:hypothetical protein